MIDLHKPSDSTPGVMFAGGGTGGHIYPNLAIRRRLEALHPGILAHFAVSSRPLDGEILEGEGEGATALPFGAVALKKPWTWLGSYRNYKASLMTCARLIAEYHVKAVVVTGGFVSVPCWRAALAAQLPVALVNLDAVPGKANSLIARRCDARFTCYDIPDWTDAQRIGLPLPARSVGDGDAAAARLKFNLDPNKPTLLVTGGSQGAETVNDLMLSLVDHTRGRRALDGWQVLHLTGPGAKGDGRFEQLRQAYAKGNIPACVETFCNSMGLAWSAASLAICRAGAGTVAEAWAHAVPAVFLPYPFHRDQHQRLNCKPLADAGSAVCLVDQRNGEANARQIMGPLDALLRNAARRQQMSRQLRASQPPNGADIVAQWVAERMDG